MSDTIKRQWVYSLVDGTQMISPEDYNLDDLISQLQEYKEKYSDQYQTLEAKYDEETGGFYLYGGRLETDKEVENRLHVERERRIRKDLIELKEYERLKAKFESEDGGILSHLRE